VRFSLYHPWIYVQGGVERVLVELLARSRHQWTIYTHHLDRAATFPELSGPEVVELDPRVSVERSLLPLIAASARIAAHRLPDDGSRALLVSSEGLGDFVVARNRLPVACFCHTPLKILFDPTARSRLRDDAPWKARALAVLGPAFAAADRAAWRRYRHIFVNSNEVARRVVAARLADHHRLEVLHPGVDTDRFSPPDPAERRRSDLLVAGRIMWQKRIDLAIDAFRLVHRRVPDSRLVVAGHVDEKSRDHLRSLQSRAEGLPVEFVINPDDPALVGLYRSATALVFTAPSEDWGIVPLEAMSCGTPVIAPDGGGPRESVIHGRTGWLVRPEPEAFAERMEVCLTAGVDLDPFRQAARDRAAEFGWDGFVERIDDVMEGLASPLRR